MKNKDVMPDKNKLDNDLNTIFAGSKDFRSLNKRKRAPVNSNKSLRIRNSIIAWGTAAATFLLIASFILPMFKDVTGNPGTTPKDQSAESPLTDAVMGMEAPNVPENDQLYIPDRTEENEPAPIFADVKVSAYTSNKKIDINYTSFGERLTTEKQAMRIADKIKYYNHMSYGVELEISMEKEETCQITVETRIYNVLLDGYYTTAKGLTDVITLENGKGTFYAATLSTADCPAGTERICMIVLTYGDSSVSYAWREITEKEGYEYNKNSAEPVPPADDPVWENTDFYAKIFASTGTDSYTVAAGENVFTKEAEFSDNPPAHSMDIVIYTSPNIKDTTAQLSLTFLTDSGKNGIYTVYQISEMDINIDPYERRGGFGIKVPVLINRYMKGYILRIYMGGVTKVYTWYENGTLSDKINYSSNFEKTTVFSSGKDITNKIYNLEDPKNADKEAVLIQLTDSEKPVEPSTDISVQMVFAENKMDSVVAILEMYEMNRASPNFMNTTGIYYWTNTDRTSVKTVEFNDLPKIEEGECRGYILSFYMGKELVEYLWYECDDSFDLSQFEGLVTEQTDFR